MIIYLLLSSFIIFIYLLNIELNICEKREGNWKGVMWRVIVLTSCLWFAIGLAKHWSKAFVFVFVCCIDTEGLNQCYCCKQHSLLGLKKSKKYPWTKKATLFPWAEKAKSCCTLLKSYSKYHIMKRSFKSFDPCRGI